MKIAEQHPMDLAISGRIGIGWGCSGGEAGGRIVASGTPEEIQLNHDSITGQYL